jgi:hypothetical protein
MFSHVAMFGQGPKFFLCLWHVRKAWVENAIIFFLQVWKTKQKYYIFILGNFMYSRACPPDHDHVLWAQLQINIMATKYPNASQFITYFKDHWAHKAIMWCVGNRNISHVG